MWLRFLAMLALASLLLAGCNLRLAQEPSASPTPPPSATAPPPPTPRPAGFKQTKGPPTYRG
ncbi:MAG: hypothetical protein F4W97_00670, partial [Chloroflexi bacterium]|nr:hypothetical protein [Chloroflexota bacterium]